jgi:hypothetical protein
MEVGLAGEGYLFCDFTVNGHNYAAKGLLPQLPPRQLAEFAHSTSISTSAPVVRQYVSSAGQASWNPA